ncbi:MAG TPA: diacylglycerol kinase family protein, partial [Bacteroidales bacterium]|nr:diacylglycerol kinase family protein [Bacteroidales bacterium]
MEFPGQDKKRALFIINPRAGVLPVNLIISSGLQRRKNIECIKTLCIDDTGGLIRKHFDEYDVFVATGGDGTVHTVAEALIGTGKILA